MRPATTVPIGQRYPLVTARDEIWQYPGRIVSIAAGKTAATVFTTIRTSRQVAQAATGLIADTATERSLGFLRNKDVGFEVRCASWHSSQQHHAARRAAITIVYRLYGER